MKINLMQESQNEHYHTGGRRPKLQLKDLYYICFHKSFIIFQTLLFPRLLRLGHYTELHGAVDQVDHNLKFMIQFQPNNFIITSNIHILYHEFWSRLLHFQFSFLLTHFGRQQKEMFGPLLPCGNAKGVSDSQLWPALSHPSLLQM